MKFVVEETLTLTGKNGDCVVELVTGDLSKPPTTLPTIDLLLVSALPNTYTETRTSLVGALARNQQISLQRFARRARLLDFQTTFQSQ